MSKPKETSTTAKAFSENLETIRALNGEEVPVQRLSLGVVSDIASQWIDGSLFALLGAVAGNDLSDPYTIFLYLAQQPKALFEALGALVKREPEWCRDNLGIPGATGVFAIVMERDFDPVFFQYQARLKAATTGLEQFMTKTPSPESNEPIPSAGSGASPES